MLPLPDTAGLKILFVTPGPLQIPLTVLCTRDIKFCVALVTHSGTMLPVRLAVLN
jgi:hypothetical protein